MTRIGLKPYKGVKLRDQSQAINHLSADYDYCRFNPFYESIKSLILGVKCVFTYQDLQRIGLKWNKYE